MLASAALLGFLFAVRAIGQPATVIANEKIEPPAGRARDPQTHTRAGGLLSHHARRAADSRHAWRGWKQITLRAPGQCA